MMTRTKKTYHNLEVVQLQSNTQVVQAQGNAQVVQLQPNTQVVQTQPNLQLVQLQPNPQVVQAQPNAQVVQSAHVVQFQPNTQVVQAQQRHTEMVQLQTNTEVYQTHSNNEVYQAQQNTEVFQAPPRAELLQNVSVEVQNVPVEVSLKTQKQTDELPVINASSSRYSYSTGTEIDTTEAFEETFGEKDKFSSWEDFITTFEEFQEKTNSVFKPRNGTTVNYVNEKRVMHKIPEKFVYQTVNMICLHYGQRHIEDEKKKEAAGITKSKKRPSYVGRNCGAYLKLSYKKGYLHITDKNLVHSNHPLIKTESDLAFRKIRPVVFSDEVDLIITKSALANKVFDINGSEANWKTSLLRLQDEDDRLLHMTMRQLKRRVHFLMDRYKLNSRGSEPLPGDEMGTILYELLREREVFMATSPSQKTRKRSLFSSNSSSKTSKVKKKRGRKPKKLARSYEEYLENRNHRGYEDEEDDDLDNEYYVEYVDDPEDDSRGLSAGASSSKRTKGIGSHELTSLINYWKERDREDRKLRREEIQVRQAEMEMRRKEMELQQQKFENDQKERIALIELLKIQGEAVAKNAAAKKSSGSDYLVLKSGTLRPLSEMAGTIMM